MSKTKIIHDLLLNNEELKFLPGVVIDDKYFKYLSEYHLKRKYFLLIKNSAYLTHITRIRDYCLRYPQISVAVAEIQSFSL
jgi:hypothetical protein